MAYRRRKGYDAWHFLQELLPLAHLGLRRAAEQAHERRAVQRVPVKGLERQLLAVMHLRSPG